MSLHFLLCRLQIQKIDNPVIRHINAKYVKINNVLYKKIKNKNAPEGYILQSAF